MPALSVGWDMYDPRLTIKATVKAGETILLGYACRINSDGEITLDLSAEGNRVHGCALTNAAGGDKLVLVTHGRLKVVDTQTRGDVAKAGTSASGNSPSTAIDNGHACGWAIETNLLFIHIDNASALE